MGLSSVCVSFHLRLYFCYFFDPFSSLSHYVLTYTLHRYAHTVTKLHMLSCHLHRSYFACNNVTIRESDLMLRCNRFCFDWLWWNTCGSCVTLCVCVYVFLPVSLATLRVVCALCCVVWNCVWNCILYLYLYLIPIYVTMSCTWQFCKMQRYLFDIYYKLWWFRVTLHINIIDFPVDSTNTSAHKMHCISICNVTVLCVYQSHAHTFQLIFLWLFE